MGRSKRAGLHLLADEKSELALSRLGGASARLWQPDALCLVEGPPSASAISLRADSEIACGSLALTQNGRPMRWPGSPAHHSPQTERSPANPAGPANGYSTTRVNP